MNWLYLILNLGSISIPLWYSFNPKMRFIQHWKKVLLSTSIVAIVFLIWDAVFTVQGVWGFNPDYYLGLKILSMPIEEWLFFFCIPYASIFIHYALAYFAPKIMLGQLFTKVLIMIFLVMSLLLIFLNHDRSYTIVNYSFLAIAMFLGWMYGVSVLRRFFISFMIILIPFFIVNGILTGTFIDAPVVWYNNEENLGVRLGTIPVEDIGYAFSMLFLNVLLLERFKEKDIF
ncbi:lycopene cyclase domain-containing protein [Aquimarina sp. 2201CG1-2-11]|uniref:lycopene cyclase domain-containing protein n=1 Tax=Aquimarina discodermiae TaxID=3231043 RepID=UPI0034635A9E